MSLSYFGLGADATETDIQTKFKELAKKLHPDKGGSTDAFNELKDARDKALQEVQFGQSLSRARLQLDALREAARGTVCPRCGGSGESGTIGHGFRRLRKVCRLCRGVGRL